MIDAYRIGIRLQLKTNDVSSGLRQIQDRFRRLHELASKTSDSLDRSRDSLRGVTGEAGRAARVLGVLARTAEATANAQAAGVVRVARVREGADRQAERAANAAQARAEREAAAAARRAEREAAAQERAAARAAAAKEAAARRAARAQEEAARQAARAWSRAFARSTSGAGQMASAARQSLGGMVGTGITAYGAGRVVNQGANIGVSMDQQRFLAGGGLAFNTEQVRRTEERAREIVASRPDHSVLGAMRTINDASVTMGRNNALQAAPMLLDFVTNMRALRQSGVQLPDDDAMMRDISAVLESRGAVYDRQGNFTPDRLHDELVGIQEYLRLNQNPNALNQLRHYVNHGGPGIASQDIDTFIANAVSLIPNAGGRAAGTMTESLVGAVNRGTFSQNFARSLIESGAARAEDLVRTSGGGVMMRRNRDGTSRQLQELTYTVRNEQTGQDETRTANPMNNAAGYQIAMVQALARRRNISIEQAAAIVFPTSATRKGGMQAYNNLQQAERVRQETLERIRAAKEARANGATPTLQQGANAVRSQTDSGHINQFHAAVNDFGTVMTDIFRGPAREAILGITGVLRQFNEFARANPEVVRQVASDMGMLFGAAGTVALVIAGFGRLYGAFALFAIGGVVMTAIEAMTGQTGLPAVATAMKGLGDALSSIPPWLITSLAAAAVAARAGPHAAAAAFGATAAAHAGAEGGNRLWRMFNGNASFDDNVHGRAAMMREAESRGITVEQLGREYVRQGFRNRDDAFREAIRRSEEGIRANRPPSVLGETSVATQAPGTSNFAVPEAQQRPAEYNITINTNMDGRRVAQEVLKIAGDQVNGPSRGFSGQDYRANPLMPGAAVPAN